MGRVIILVQCQYCLVRNQIPVGETNQRSTVVRIALPYYDNFKQTFAIGAEMKVGETGVKCLPMEWIEGWAKSLDPLC